MGRPLQVYVAPGRDDEPLQIAPSPWHRYKYVRIPFENWEVLVELLRSVHPDAANMIDDLSWARDDNELDLIEADSAQLTMVLAGIDMLRKGITDGSVVVKPRDELADNYEPAEYMRMLDAVAAVFQESLRTGDMFRAWRE